MNRKLLLFCTAIFLICFFSGCICFFSGCVVLPGNNTSDSDESKIPGGSSVTTEPDGAEPNDISLDALQKKISQSSIAVGVAFIGYVDSERKRICAPILQAVKPGRNILFSPVRRLSSRKDRSCMQSYRQIKKQP